MRTLIFWPVAASLLVAGCSAGGAVVEGSASVTSASASGEVAGTDNTCITWAPATRPLSYLGGGTDGFVGTIVNATGGDIYINLQNESPCLLPNGQSAPYASGTPLNGRSLYASATSGSPRAGTRFIINDPYVGLPSVQAFSFDEGAGSCVGSSSGAGVKLSEGDSESLDEVGTGSFTAVRLPDDAGAARKWTGASDSSQVDDWARVDITVNRLARCS